MKKLIKQYEEKNKIIQQIQKNLRMGHPRGVRSEQKNVKLNKKSFRLDLPTIHLRHDYSPKSLHKSIDKKQEIIPYQSKQQMKIQTKNQVNKPWIQTIRFECQDQKYGKPRILMNHRTTLINFMRSTHRSQGNKSFNQQQDKNQIFLSPSKYFTLSKEKKLKLSKLSSFISNQEKRNPIVLQQDLSSRYSKKVMEEIISSHAKQNKQIKTIKNPQIQNSIDLYSSNTIDITPTGQRRVKQKRNRNKRGCSPWNSQKQSEELGEIWNSDM